MKLSILVLLLLFLNTFNAESCQCGRRLDDLLRDFAESDAVFTGKVVYSDKSFMIPWLTVKFKVASWTGQHLEFVLPRDGVSVTLEVHESWKGVLKSPVTVISGYDRGDCGYPFEVGQEYLVFTSFNQGQFSASKCSRTQPLALAAVDLKALGKAQTPQKRSLVAYVVQRHLTGVAVGAILILGVAVIIVRRKRRNR